MSTGYQQPLSGDAAGNVTGGAGPAAQSMSLDLTRVNNIVVAQEKRGWLFELFCFETESSYKISTLEQRENVFMYAKEESQCLTRYFCGSNRNLTIDITVGDQPGGPVLAQYERPLKCPTSCCCAPQEMRTVVGGAPSGHTTLPCVLCKCGAEADVYDSSGMQMYKVKGPCISCGRPVFQIHQGTTTDGPIVGAIQKEWGGLAKECCTDADTFSIVFPASADAQARANLIGTTFLLDYNFFEHAKNGDA